MSEKAAYKPWNLKGKASYHDVNDISDQQQIEMVHFTWY